MNIRRAIIVTAIAFAAAGAFAATSAGASVIYSETFDASTFAGSQLDLSGDPVGNHSDRWTNNNYFNINNANGWTFSGGAYLAANANTNDGALLLNENGGNASGGPGGEGATTITGLTAGQTYKLTFLLSGDNRAGDPYVLNVDVGGVTTSYNGVDGAIGANPGATETIYFSPTSSTESLVLSQASTTQASPIVDNISISAVPEPATWAMVLMGLGGLGLAMRSNRKLAPAAV